MIEKTLGVFLANKLDVFTFTSPLLQKAYNDFGLEEKKSFIIRDFVDANSLVRTEKERTYGDAVTILCSGRMVWEKGFDIAIKALAALKDKERFRLVLSGDGPEKENLEKLAKDLQVEQSVSFPGWVSKEKLLEFLKTADIFVLPRWRPELASMLLFEALAFGTPSLVPGKSTLSWSAGEGAMTFKDLDALDLADKLSKLASSEELRTELSRKALRRVEELNYKKPALELNNLMQKLCK